MPWHDDDHDPQDYLLPPPPDRTARQFDGVTPSYEAEHVRMQAQEEWITTLVLLGVVGLLVVLLAFIAATVVIAEPAALAIHPDCPTRAC